MTHYEKALRELETAHSRGVTDGIYYAIRAVTYALLDVSTALAKIAGESGIVYTRDADRV